MSDLIQRLKQAAEVEPNEKTKGLLTEAVTRIEDINRSYDLLCIERSRYGEALRDVVKGEGDAPTIAKTALEPGQGGG